MVDAKYEKKVYVDREWEDEIWATVSVLANGQPPSGMKAKVSGFISKLYRAAANMLGKKLFPNPYFLGNGLEEGANNATVRYMLGRSAKTAAGVAQGIATGALKVITVVDPVSMGKVGASIASTGFHMHHLSQIGARWKHSRTVTGWIDLCMELKKQKLAAKGIAMAAACIPYVPSEAHLAIKAVAMTPTVVGLADSFVVVPGFYGALVARTSAELHWRAYREHVISGRTGAVGPASAILHELFTKRTQTRLLGKHDTDGLIKEPCGWIAIQNKIGLL